MIARESVRVHFESEGRGRSDLRSLTTDSIEQHSRHACMCACGRKDGKRWIGAAQKRGLRDCGQMVTYVPGQTDADAYVDSDGGKSRSVRTSLSDRQFVSGDMADCSASSQLTSEQASTQAPHAIPSRYAAGAQADLQAGRQVSR